MRIIDCKSCGSSELYEEAGYIFCAFCRSRFVPDDGDIPKPASVIALESDVEVLLRKCVEDPSNRRRYISLILDIDPNNQQVRNYL
jgi:hypothetical protein